MPNIQPFIDTFFDNRLSPVPDRAFIILFLCLVGFGICTTVAQPPTLHELDDLTHQASIFFNKENGLPTNQTRSVTETEDGFIWIGTAEGLCRFDGSEFKVFTHDPNDSTSIYDHRVTPIIADSQRLWLGTYLGFSVMDMKTEKFRNYQFQNFRVRDSMSRQVATRVLCMEKDHEGHIWIGAFDDAVFRYLPERDTFINYRYLLEPSSRTFPVQNDLDHVLALKQDRFSDNYIWVGTTGGLLRINRETDDVRWYLYPERETRFFAPQNAVRRIYQHDDGRLYLSSWHAGVNIFDPNTEAFYPLPLNNRTEEELKLGEALLNTPIGDIVRKNANEIWIQTLEGLMTYNTETKSWVKIRRNKINEGETYGIGFIDSQKRNWLSRSDGLRLFDPLQQQFLQYDFDQLNPDLFGFAYYFMEPSPFGDFAVLSRSADGIYFLDVSQRKWEKMTIPEKYREIHNGFTPRGCSQGPSGRWTIISLSGIYEFDPEQKSIRSLSAPQRLLDQSMRSVLWDSNGRLWVGTDNEGLFRWSPRENKWEHIKDALEPEGSKTRSGTLTALFEDSKRNIWIRRREGFSVYSSERDTFYNLIKALNPVNSMSVQEFVEDQDGRVWMNSPFGMLGYAEVDSPEKGIKKKFNLRSTFNIEGLYFMRGDQEGMIWGTFNKYLYRINPNTLEADLYNLQYGVKDYDDLYGLKILSDGRIVLGGRNKLWITDLAKLRANPEKPRPYLTGVSILQEPIQSSIPTHLISELRLEYAENFFSFDFSSIGFMRGHENKFRFRLKNFDDKWTEANERRFANFTNVPSGQYVFELQAANNEGVWNEEVFRLPVSIATPWWQSIWFWSMATCGILGLAYLIYRWRIRQVRREERLRSHYENKLREMEMSALRAQMNPHFIFNSLNSIEYYIISNEPEKASDYLNRFSRLIRLILQNSKSTIVPLKDDLEALRLYIEIESMRFDNLFDYEVKVQEGINMESVKVPPMLLQPYVENAIWHGLMQKKGEKGKIDLTLRRNNGTLICLIEDNGIGREAAEKLKSKTATRKKSFGMKITKDRLETLNRLAGTKASVQIFDLKNDTGQASGTRVELVIPL